MSGLVEKRAERKGWTAGRYAKRGDKESVTKNPYRRPKYRAAFERGFKAALDAPLGG